MTLIEQIERQIRKLPPERQSEVLDFSRFLERQGKATRTAKRKPLREHPAFGSWRGRSIDALEYEHRLRAEWDGRP